MECKDIFCGLCQSPKVHRYQRFMEKCFGVICTRLYWRCECCGMIFLDPSLRLSSEEELSRYRTHDNSLENLGYVEFLKQLWLPMEELLNSSMGGLSKESMRGLDFGCGPGPTLHQIASRSDYQMDLYDPYFYPIELTEGSYDFITCTEVIEHLASPSKEWMQLKNLLKPNGILGVMTYLYDGVIGHGKTESFRDWSYRKDDTHISFYSKKTLNYISEYFGFNLLECHPRWQIFQVSHKL